MSTTETFTQHLRKPRIYVPKLGQEWINRWMHYASWIDSVTKGDNLPDWRAKIARCENATTQLSGVKYVDKCRSGNVSYTAADHMPGYLVVGLKGWPEKFTFRVPSSFSSTSGPADEEAKSRFLQNAIKANTYFQGGVALGELGETIRMLRNPAKALRNALPGYVQTAKKRSKQVRRSNRERRLPRKQVHKVLAETWLEHVFGWIPLINDIDGANAALKRMNRAPFKTQHVYAEASKKSLFQEYTRYTQFGYCGFHQTYHEIDESIVIYRGAVKYDISNPILMNAKLLGFSWQEFAPTVWELIPYSFLVDYFTNIGNIIEGWSYGDLNLNWCNRTQIDKSIVKTINFKPNWDFINANKDAGHVLSTDFSQPPKVHLEYRKIERATYSGSFVPSFRMKIPGIGSQKWINIGALATLRFL